MIYILSDIVYLWKILKHLRSSRDFTTFTAPLLMKIRIIWPTWSGKTHLGLFLAHITWFPVFHTDHLVYEQKFVTKKTKESQEKELGIILSHYPDRIIEWTTIWHIWWPSIIQADVIIYCNQPRYILWYRLIKRYLQGKQEGQKFVDLFWLLKYACDYRSVQYGVNQALKQYNKKIVLYPFEI